MKALFILIVFALYPSHATAQCGEERWAVKILADRDTSKIHWVEQSATVHEQGTLPRPNKAWERMPRQLSESQAYVLSGMLIVWGMEGDGDYHLVIQNIKGETIVCEIPDPDCDDVKETPRSGEYRLARTWVDKNIGVPSRIMPVPKPTPVTIHGIGFWEKRNHGLGRAKNGREIHPVYGIE